MMVCKFRHYFCSPSAVYAYQAILFDEFARCFPAESLPASSFLTITTSTSQVSILLRQILALKPLHPSERSLNASSPSIRSPLLAPHSGHLNPSALHSTADGPACHILGQTWHRRDQIRLIHSYVGLSRTGLREPLLSP